MLFSIWSLEDEFALRVESGCYSGLGFSFMIDGHGFAEHVCLFGPFTDQVFIIFL